MKMKLALQTILQLLLLITALSATALSCTTQASRSERLTAAVSFPPQVEFVSSIAGDKVDIILMMPPGSNPHTYEITPSQITALSKAGAYIEVGSGVEFELVWLDKLTDINRDMRIIDCSAGVQLIETAEEHADGHIMSSDPHIWMSPRNAMVMAQNIRDGLVQIDPANKDYYEQNCNEYLQKLSSLDRDIEAGLSGLKNRMFMVQHPSFAYFARDYNLAMLSIEQEGKEPSPAGIVSLIEQAKEHNIKTIFTSPQTNPAESQVVADALGAEMVLIDPLAGDYIDNMRTFLDGLAQSME